MQTDVDWERGGEETYIYRFWVSLANQKKGYIIKACVTLDLERGIEGTIEEWLRRRQLLEKYDVSVPHLVYSGEGMIIEEFIPWLLFDHLQNNALVTAQTLLSLVDYTATLSRLGFAPLDFLSDLRTRGNDIVVVDFGEDLGSPNMTNKPNLQLLDTLEEALLSRKIISGKLPTNLQQWFYTAIKDIH